LTCPAPRVRGDAGTGVVAMWGALLVFLLFLFFAVQLLYGLYATTTVTAVVNDAGQRAAAAGGAGQEGITADLARDLGGIDSDPEIRWSDDDCADGTIDLGVSVDPPRFLPSAISDVAGIGTIEREVHVRCERLVG
jgi:hypothetical protein